MGRRQQHEKASPHDRALCFASRSVRRNFISMNEIGVVVGGVGVFGTPRSTRLQRRHQRRGCESETRSRPPQRRHRAA